MKHFLALFLAFAMASSALAVTGRVGPYTYAYDGTPVNAAVTAIDPPPGAIVISNSSAINYYKLSANGTNSTYTTREVIFDSGTTALTGTAAQTITIGIIPSFASSFVFTRGDVVVTNTNGITAAPTFLFQSGTGTVFTGTSSLGTTVNTLTSGTVVANPPIAVMSGTARNIEVRTIATGTFTGLTVRAFARGYFVPSN